MNKRSALFLFPLLVSLCALHAQTAPTDPNMVSTQFDMTGFPQWAKDLRRGSIIAFGTFPFMYFFSSFGVDLYRCGSHGWDRRYAPWPFDGAGSVGKNQGQKIATIGIAAGGSVLVALIDYGIVAHKRKVKQRETIKYPEGVPIIIRSPLYMDEAEADDSENGNP